MKKIILLNFIFIFLFTAVSFSKEIDITTAKITYQLSSDWYIANDKAGDLQQLRAYKRKGIVDSKGVEVIPNVMMIFMGIANPGAKDIDSQKEMLNVTKFLLGNYSPPATKNDYEKSLESKSNNNFHKLNLPYSYVFNSPYLDTFRENHTCLYYTFFVKDKAIGLIMIDSTDEIYKKVDKEIEQFIKSITVK